MNRRKALLAMFFASGMVASQVPAVADVSNQSAPGAIQKVSDNHELMPNVRAFYLLKMAASCIDRAGDAEIDRSCSSLAEESRRMENHKQLSLLSRWTLSIGLQPAPGAHARKLSGPTATDYQPTPSKSSAALAKLAIKKALDQLTESEDTVANLNFYFIASHLYQKIRDTAGASGCEKLLAKALHQCEVGNSVHADDIEAACSILNLESQRILPVTIESVYIGMQGGPWHPPARQPVPDYTDEDFRRSEKLKLRAVAMEDRLPTDNHARRMAHRNLALWYERLGKSDLAEGQKRALYSLVGVEDDSILYPQVVSCGHLIWWNPQPPVSVSESYCGMG